MPVPLVFAALDYSTTLKTTFYGLLVVGFVVAVVVGSIAWYNSKKPAGWEDAEKPDWVPKVGSGKTAETESKESLD